MSNKVAIILWLYHTDLANEFIELLKPHKHCIDIFLGLCKDHDNSSAVQLFNSHFSNNLFIHYLENGGTDILPTLRLLEQCINYKIFFKLHSKKSNWGTLKHVNWRSILINDIIYNNNFLTTIEQLQQKNTGIVCSKAFRIHNHEYTNVNKIKELCQLLSIDQSKIKHKNFIGGNIFAAKTDIFRSLLYNQQLYTLLSQEVGEIKDDTGGTYVHSMERIFGYMAEYNNQTIAASNIKTQIILNPKIKKHRLHLVQLYNNECYVQENPNIYGDIITHTDKQLIVKWKHITNNQTQIYNKVSKYLINQTIC